MTSLALLLLLCLVMEGLFTASEMVLVAADRNRLHDRARRGDLGAVKALELLERPERAIAVCLTGTNLFVVLSSVAVTSRLIPEFGEGASWIAAAVVTPLVVLFGEILPKSFAVSRADRYVVAAARLVRVSRWLFLPLVEPAFLLGQGVARLFGGGSGEGAGSPDREELRLLLQASREGQTDMASEERVMVRRVFRFGERRVVDIYRPMAQVAAIPEGITCREAAREASRHGYSRYPAFRGRVDQVTGFLHVLDVVGQEPGAPVAPLLRKCLFVPEPMPVDELMRRFRQGATSFAVVVDEFGGVSGIVTAEDVVEEVVGEIEDEYDEEVDYHEGGGRELVLPGRFEVVRLEEVTGLSLPKGEYASVGGMLTALAERIPAEGESFDAGGAVFTVVRATDRAVKQVRVTLPGPVPREEEGGASPPGGGEGGAGEER